ncbi:MAG: hypothetical protein LBM38_03595 [Clostridiales bacterium]|nr:hypothetical protein [Clostridiales bacterium]
METNNKTLPIPKYDEVKYTKKEIVDKYLESENSDLDFSYSKEWQEFLIDAIDDTPFGRANVDFDYASLIRNTPVTFFKVEENPNGYTAGTILSTKDFKRSLSEALQAFKYAFVNDFKAGAAKEFVPPEDSDKNKWMILGVSENDTYSLESIAFHEGIHLLTIADSVLIPLVFQEGIANILEHEYSQKNKGRESLDYQFAENYTSKIKSLYPCNEVFYRAIKNGNQFKFLTDVIKLEREKLNSIGLYSSERIMPIAETIFRMYKVGEKTDPDLLIKFNTLIDSIFDTKKPLPKDLIKRLKKVLNKKIIKKLSSKNLDKRNEAMQKWGNEVDDLGILMIFINNFGLPSGKKLDYNLLLERYKEARENKEKENAIKNEPKPQETKKQKVTYRLKDIFRNPSTVNYAPPAQDGFKR